MEFFRKLLFLLSHLNDNDAWREMINYIGTPSLYGVLIAIIFLETGVVIMPFLPGDSLLFAIGAMTARDIGLDFWLLFAVLTVAAVVGDAVNYFIGYRVGPAIFSHDVSDTAKKKLSDRLLNRDHLLKAQAFYEKHGGKTIILARFVPIIRTFAPFVAGIGKMSYPRFALYNVVGGVAWVFLCMAAGRFFGRFEIVQKRFELVIVAIVLISVLPMVIEFIKARRAAKRGTPDPLLEATTIGEKVEP